MFQLCFKVIKELASVFFKGFEKEVSKVFQATFKVVSWKFQGYVKSASKVLPGCFKVFCFFTVFQGSFVL